MNRCLSDRVLVMLSIGEGTAAEREHVVGCAACTGRYDEMLEDLEMIGEALRGVPPPDTVAGRSPLPSLRWLAVPAVAAAVVTIIAAAHWLLEPPAVEVRLRTPPVAAVPVISYAEEVAVAVFGMEGRRNVPGMVFESGSGSYSPRVVDAPELEKALEIGSPCTGRRFVGADCNDYTTALFF